MKKALQMLNSRSDKVNEFTIKKEPSPLKRRINLMPQKKSNPSKSRTKQGEQLNSAQGRKESGNESDENNKKETI